MRSSSTGDYVGKINCCVGAHPLISNYRDVLPPDKIIHLVEINLSFGYSGWEGSEH